MKKSEVIYAIATAKGISDKDKLSAIEHICGIVLDKRDTVSMTIKASFVWVYTPQGHKFWEQMYCAVGGE